MSSPLLDIFLIWNHGFKKGDSLQIWLKVKQTKLSLLPILTIGTETNLLKRSNFSWLITLNLGHWIRFSLNICTFYTWRKKSKIYLHQNPPMISFHSARKLSNYSVRAKMYRIWSNNCDSKRCEVCIDVHETFTFTNRVIRETSTINHKFDCNARHSFYFLTCRKCKVQYVG